MGKVGDQVVKKTVKERAEAFIENIRKNDDISANGGGAVDAAILEYLVAHGQIVELKKWQTSLEFEGHSAVFENKIKKNGSYEKPVYVIPGIGKEDHSSLGFEVSHEKNDKTHVKVSYLTTEGNHIYDADYFQKHIMPTNAEIQNSPKYSKGDIYDDTPELKKRYGELTAFAAEEARRQGIESPILLLKKGIGRAHAFDSKEGQHYIALPYEYTGIRLRLAEVSGDLLGMGFVKDEIREEVTKIKNGGTSPASVIIEQEKSRFNEHPFNDKVIGNATLESLVKEGRLVKRERSDLKPQAMSDPALKNNNFPVYVIPHPDFPGESAADLAHTKEGKPYIIINEGYNKNDQRYASEHIDNIKDVTPDEFLKRLTKMDGVSTEQIERYKTLMASLSDKIREMGIAPTDIRIIQDPKYFEMEGRIDDGKKTIIIGEGEILAALRSDASKEQTKSSGDHEAAHIYYKDPVTPLPQNGDYLLEKRYREFRADVGVDNPLVNAESLKVGYLLDVFDNLGEQRGGKLSLPLSAEYVKGNPTDHDLKVISDWGVRNRDPEHPGEYDRIAVLKDADQVRKEYEKTHQVVTDSDRNREREYILAKVAQDMNGLWGVPMPVSNKPLPADVPFTMLPGGRMPTNAPFINSNAPPEKPESSQKSQEPLPLSSAQKQEIKQIRENVTVMPEGTQSTYISVVASLTDRKKGLT